MGALVISQRKAPQFIGNRKVVYFIGTPSGTSGAGGETISLKALGLNRLDYIDVNPIGTSTATYIPHWNNSRTAPAIKFFAASNNAPLGFQSEDAGATLGHAVQCKAVGT